MALQVKTIRGRKYIYDVKSYWDKEAKKYRKTTVYMGPCVNEETREYAPKKSSVVKTSTNREIVNFGDTNILHRCLQNSKLNKAIEAILPDSIDTLKVLLFHKIIDGGASKSVSNWYDGNIAKVFFPNARVDSQRISEFLASLGNENVQRQFFKSYMSEIADISGDVVIDSTGLENEANLPITEYSGKSEQNEARMIMVIDRVTHMPLYFRLVAGNIVDVSTLTTTFSLMKNFGVEPAFAVMDAGYYSSDNVKSLCKSKISFLSRLPAGRKLYSQMIEQTSQTLENPENIVVYNKRSLYIQKVKVDLYGYVGYAYICCDIKQKGVKLDKFLRDAKDDNLTNDEIKAKIPFIGKFILVSNKELKPEELLPLYYTRQVAETTFGFAKTKLNLLPLRVHNLQTLKGYTFLSYVALLLSLEIQNKLKEVCTLQETLGVGHNQFCEIFDREFISLEPNRRLKEIYGMLGVMVDNGSGE